MTDTNILSEINELFVTLATVLFIPQNTAFQLLNALQDFEKFQPNLIEHFQAQILSICISVIFFFKKS